MRYSGRVASGRGEARHFTTLDWVRDALVRALAIEPFPGTLNLVLDAGEFPDGIRPLAAAGGVLLSPPPGSSWCAGRCHPVRVGGRFPAAAVVPLVDGYPDHQLEVVCALSLRESLGLSDGDRLDVEVTSPLPVRAVLFDVDGTLVESLTAMRVVAAKAAAMHGFEVTDALVRWSMTTGQSFWHLVVPPEHPAREATIEAMRTEASRHWAEALRVHGGVHPGAADVVRAIHEAGAGLGIVTGARRGSFGPLRDAGVFDLFGALVTRSDVEQGKPHPEGLLKCCDSLGVDPGEAVYVGDTPDDVVAASAAGMASVAVLTGAGDSAALTRFCPDRLVPSVERLFDAVSPSSLADPGRRPVRRTDLE